MVLFQIISLIPIFSFFLGDLEDLKLKVLICLVIFCLQLLFSKKQVKKNAHEKITELNTIFESSNTGLQFPVEIIWRCLQGKYAAIQTDSQTNLRHNVAIQTDSQNHIKENTVVLSQNHITIFEAALSLTCILEYLSAEICEISGNVARDHKVSRITSKHIQIALRNDEDFKKLGSSELLPKMRSFVIEELTIDDDDSDFHPEDKHLEEEKTGTEGEKKQDDNVDGLIAKVESFESFLYKVLKQLHPNANATFSKRGISVVNSLINESLQHIISEAEKSATMKKKKSDLSYDDIETATRSLLSGELEKYAISNMTKTLNRYQGLWIKLKGKNLKVDKF